MVDNNPLIFRKPRKDEGPLLTDLALRLMGHWPYSAEYLQKCRPVVTVDEAYFHKEPLWVMEKNRVPVGFYSFLRKDNKAWLEYFWLEPSFIGQGLGRELFRHALGIAKEAELVPFYILSDPFAMKFYLKMGCGHLGFENSLIYSNMPLPLLVYPSAISPNRG